MASTTRFAMPENPHENSENLPEETKAVLSAIQVDATAALPLHIQIRDSLALLMDGPALPPGARLPKLRQIAAACGVGLYTVAQAVELLQHEGRVTSRVRRGVFVSKTLPTPAQAVIYVCINPVFMTVNGGARFRTLQGIINKAHELDVELHPAIHGGEVDLERLSGGRAGVVFMTSAFEPDGFSELARYVQEHRIPHIVANEPRSPFSGVDAHHDKAICLSTEHLLRLGHRRVAFVNRHMGEAHRRPAQCRAGYFAALRRYGVWPDPDLYAESEVPTSPTHTGTGEILGRWLALPDPPTGIVCDSDERALLVLELLKSRGLSVPKDISVVGHENMPATASSVPPLTTVDACCPERGVRSVEYVLAWINGDNPAEPEVLPKMVVRKSTAPLEEPSSRPAVRPGGAEERRPV